MGRSFTCLHFFLDEYFSKLANDFRWNFDRDMSSLKAGRILYWLVKFLGSYSSTYCWDYTAAGDGMKFTTKLHRVASQETVILIISVDIGLEREVNLSVPSTI
jgi:hypothetical protein